VCRRGHAVGTSVGPRVLCRDYNRYEPIPGRDGGCLDVRRMSLMEELGVNDSGRRG